VTRHRINKGSQQAHLKADWLGIVEEDTPEVAVLLGGPSAEREGVSFNRARVRSGLCGTGNFEVHRGVALRPRSVVLTWGLQPSLMLVLKLPDWSLGKMVAFSGIP